MQEVEQIGQSNPVRCSNWTDDFGNPTGGYAHGPGMCIAWQDGPRGKDEAGKLAPANGAFVEDALVAAHQRLAYFQKSQFACRENDEAMQLIRRALDKLEERAAGRRQRGVLGQHEV